MVAIRQPILSAKRRALLEYIIEHLADKGYPPTYRQMMVRFNWRSISAVQQKIEGLERLGYIEREFGGYRTITILKGADE